MFRLFRKAMFGEPTQVGYKYGYINTKGQIVIKPQFSEASTFNNGYAVVGKYFINKQGKRVLGSYEGVSDFSEGLAAVKKGGKWGYINTSGKMVISPRFDYCGGFSGGLAVVKINKKYGYINKSGQEVIKPQFAQGDSFRDGLARVMTADDYSVCYIDTKGNYRWKPAN